MHDTAVGFALRYQFAQQTFNAAQMREPLLHNGQLVCGDGLGFAAVLPVVQREQVRDLLEREA